MKPNIFTLGAIHSYIFKVWLFAKTACPLSLNILTCSHFLPSLHHSLHLTTSCTTFISQNNNKIITKWASTENTYQGSQRNDYCTCRHSHNGRDKISRCGRLCKTSISSSICVSDNEEIRCRLSKFHTDLEPDILSQTSPQELSISLPISLSRLYLSDLSVLKAEKERVWKEKEDLATLLVEYKILLVNSEQDLLKKQLWQ